MGFARRSGKRLYWRLEGASDRPVLLLLHPLGSDLNSWDLALPWLTRRLRVLRMDFTGHGASDVQPGDHSLQSLADDVVAVMDASSISRAAICGLSLGGMVAMSLAQSTPERVSALVCACTSARMDGKLWAERIATIRSQGLAAVADAALQRYFSPAFAQAHPEITGTIRTALLGMDAEGYAGCAAAIRDMDLIPRLGQIRAPTLVISGQYDVSTPLRGHGEHLLAGIAGAEGCELPAAHFAALETPEAFANAVCAFVDGPRSATASGGIQESQRA
ncbi:MAG TPA: 3-oxoadipate enol-lactonase [Steroidobacteraceae bacterium]|nr:3-oxoadipate enol-lactonase [Steroidobacteraceae bacterium]